MFPSAFTATAQNLSASGGSHSLPKTMFVLSFSVSGLVCSLHYHSILSPGKYTFILIKHKEISSLNITFRQIWEVGQKNRKNYKKRIKSAGCICF
jgi:hypothetical protein